MWSPTHIEVTILRARNLLTKGKHGTNNCFVTIGMDKEKYQTSLKEKAEPNVSWEEACELKIPDQGNRAELVLICLHRNNLGIDEFLGQVTLPLNTMDAYDRPRQRWCKLESKPGQEKKSKERGELEVRIGFIVKSGSLSDLSKKEKHKSSFGQLAASVGGSLLSIGTIEKRKGIKNFATTLGSKIHLHRKKKNKEGDDGSINGSLASIDTPNGSRGGSRRRGQHADDADPGVISEDEDEFAFDNLSHKSSGSSLNTRSNYLPKHVSPLFNKGNNIGKRNSKEPEIVITDPELEQIENDFSIRAHTLPPPSKPPRTQQIVTDNLTAEKPLDEWESKLVGNNVGSVQSLKRRSWERNALMSTPVEKLNTASKTTTDEKEDKNEERDEKSVSKEPSDSDSSSSDDEIEENEHEKPIELKVETKPKIVTPRINLLTPEEENKSGFQVFNESFSKFEQFAKIQDKDSTVVQYKAENPTPAVPKALPRTMEQNANANNLKKQETEVELNRQKAEQERIINERKKEEEIEKQRKKRAQEEREARDKEEETQRRETKRREEDQRLLNFAKRSISGESDANSASTPEQSPKERGGSEKQEKRLSKFKYFKRDKHSEEHNSPSPKSTERIIIGHEKSTTHAERRSEISAALAKKYEGKSRDELMLIANGMENEALFQRQRVKELEDYLDNLLLRVMETHPKILQNPYSRTTSAKSFKNYIDMNDFL